MDADKGRAEGLLEQAMAVVSNYSLEFAKARLRRAEGRCRKAIPQYEAVLAYYPNFAFAMIDLGRCKTLEGPFDDVLALKERAIRLMPRGLESGLPYFFIGQAYLLRSRTDDAIVWLEKHRGKSFLAAAYALKGEANRATAEPTEARG